MAEKHGGRVCPKCGMNMGQRHLCPICDKTEENTGSAPNPTADAGGNTAPAASQTADYVSRLIEFIGGYGYMYDWDKEFNTFFDGLPGEHSYEEYHDACSKVSGIFGRNRPDSDKVSGSMTIKVMNELKAVFPDLSDEEARGLAMDLLDYRIAPLPPRRSPEVMKMYLNAKRKNDSEAQYNLGYACEHGKGVEKDKAEAVKWYRKAAEQGHAEAQNNLGRAYEYGKGVNRDIPEAVKWYRKAAEQGNEAAQEKVSSLKKVVDLLDAAGQGNPDAMFKLGKCYNNGEGVTPDYAEAVKWYRKAAEQGNASAQYNLGRAYDYGKGVKKDKAEAVKWLRKAAEQGDTEAKEELAIILWGKIVVVVGVIAIGIVVYYEIRH